MKAQQVFIQNLEQLLEEKDLSQKDLAERLGIKPSGITKLLKNNANPGLNTLSDLAEALEVPITSLITDPTNRKENPIPPNLLNKLTKLDPNQRETLFKMFEAQIDTILKMDNRAVGG